MTCGNTNLVPVLAWYRLQVIQTSYQGCADLQFLVYTCLVQTKKQPWTIIPGLGQYECGYENPRGGHYQNMGNKTLPQFWQHSPMRAYLTQQPSHYFLCCFAPGVLTEYHRRKQKKRGKPFLKPKCLLQHFHS